MEKLNFLMEMPPPAPVFKRDEHGKLLGDMRELEASVEAFINWGSAVPYAIGEVIASSELLTRTLKSAAEFEDKAFWKLIKPGAKAIHRKGKAQERERRRLLMLSYSER